MTIGAKSHRIRHEYHLRLNIENTQSPYHNHEIAELSLAQKRLRDMITRSNEPVDLLLYRSRRQSLQQTI